MDKIYNIKYVDASYSYEESIKQTKLDLYEAYGYVKNNKNNIIIIFIKKRKIGVGKIINRKESVPMGLVIPDTALILTSRVYKNEIMKNVSINSSISVTWRDVVHVENLPRYDCPVMYTEGILIKTDRDYIILKDPKTIRVHPRPIKNHPGSGLPTYLVIPISFITEIAVIK